MKKRITLPWADEFRSLLKSEPFYEDVIKQYKIYIKEQEDEINSLYNLK